MSLLRKINEDGIDIDGLKAQIEEVGGEKTHLLLRMSDLDLELQIANLQLSDVRKVLVQTEAEKDSLIEEKSAILIKINESDMAVHALRAQIEEFESEKSQLQLEMSHLDHEIQYANLQFTDVKHAFVQTELERNSLFQGKLGFLRKMNEDGVVIDGLKAQVNELEIEESHFLQKIINLDLEIQSAKLQLINIKTALLTVEDEKKALISGNSVVESKLLEAEFMKEKLQAEMRELNHRNSTLLSKIDETEKAAIDFQIERDGLIADNLQLNNKVKELLTQFQSKMVDFDRKLEATSSEMQDLRSKLKLAQKEVSPEIQTSINSNRGHDFQAINTETGDLDQEIQKLASISTEAEKDSLIEEKSAILIKINESDMAVHALRAQIEEVESEKSQLQLKISNLDLEIQSAKLQLINIKTALLTVEDEKKALISGNSVIESKLLEAEFMKEKLQAEMRELNHRNSTLLSKIDETEKAAIDFQIERDGLIADNLQLNNKVKELLT
ncbi:hypothetical protein KSP39_PZI010615 [Platanthera zijinensis]|uniref:Uncharacterized protein n=1 Tax=Platanthera zijinensis TaxID=2320716 RepID=A0AAP0BI76_9ASPA